MESDIKTLQPGNWLVDNIINFYMKCPQYMHSTDMFYSKNISEGHAHWAECLMNLYLKYFFFISEYDIKLGFQLKKKKHVK